MPSKKRTVKYEEEVNPTEHKVEVTEEHSTDSESNQQEEPEERYTPADGR